MNETLQNASAEILIGAAETVGQAKDFVLSELPDVVQQLLAWKFAMSLVAFGAAIVLMLAGLLVPAIVGRRLDPDAWGLWYIGSLTVWLFGGMFIDLSLDAGIFEWVQIWLAPKVYLIEYAADLVK